MFRIGVSVLAYASLRSAATRPIRPVNIGGEGEVPGTLNLQGRWALTKGYGRSTDGKTLAQMILEGIHFLIYNARSGKLPFKNNSVPKVYTNSVPIDTPPGGLYPGVSSSEIERVLVPGGQWVRDGIVVFTKPL